ncbi:MAG: hypothetical protein K2I80_07550 [Ruminococcus sp.]|nr:hypothetical protein [Ruminococcus sp.]
MKKYLSIICVLLTLTAFTSCGDNNSNSDSSKVSESIVLDSVFENDYLKIAVDDDWKERTETLDGTHYIYWSWKDEASSRPNITLDITENDSGKMSMEDFKSAYEFADNNYNHTVYINGLRFFNNTTQLVDIFEVNNQAYLVTANAITHCMFFKTDKIAGNFVYPIKDEKIVMDMIKSIEFKTIESITETTTKHRTKKNTYTTKSKESTEKVTQPVTEPPTEKVPETQPPVIETSPVQTALHFVLNLETGCIHINPDCSAALNILPENYSTVDIADSDLSNYSGIYWACGKCSKRYSDELPKF